MSSRTLRAARRVASKVATTLASNRRNASSHTTRSLKLPDHSFKSRLSRRLTAIRWPQPPTSISRSLIHLSAVRLYTRILPLSRDGALPSQEQMPRTKAVAYNYLYAQGVVGQKRSTYRPAQCLWAIKEMTINWSIRDRDRDSALSFTA